METKNIERRFDFDWLRVLAILAVFIFHCTRIFDTDDWSIKNSITYSWVDIWNEFAMIWGMPLILLISGVSAFYALEKVKPGKYILGLLARLGLPLGIGMFTHVAFQVYLENLQKGTFHGSFLQFYPHYFEGMYGFGGNFAWMGLHLWYLELLLLLAWLFLPIFWWLKKSASGQWLLRNLGNLLAVPGGVFLLALPVSLLLNKLDPATWGNRALGGWSVMIYPFFFIAGFVVISNKKLQDRIKQMRWISLGLGIILAGVYLSMEFQPDTPRLDALERALDGVLLSLSVWSWLFAALGFGMRHFTPCTPFLKYANEAVLPFYILHQTVIVTLGYFVVQWAIPDGIKFLIILAASFLVTISLYEFLIRRNNVLRFLFGMKLRARSAAVQPQDIHGIEPARTL